MKKNIIATSSQDPTFETQGPMRVFLSNQTDLGGTNAFPFLMLNPPNTPFFGFGTGGNYLPSLTYGPAGNPPPPWNQGSDWQVLASGLAIPPLQMPIVYQNGSTTQAYPVGNAEAVYIADRSNNLVVTNGQYILDFPFVVGGTWLSIHFVITGVAGGSTVLPGFGLYNLGSNPGAWTYLAPTSFDGLWSIQLRSDDFFNYLTLSLSYVRYSDTNPLGPMSRLVYAASGLGAFNSLLTPYITKQKVAQKVTTNNNQISAIDIFRTESDYQILTTEDEKLTV